MNESVRSPLRILEVEPFGRGGLAHYAYNLSQGLAERGHDVSLLTASGFELGDRVDPREGVAVIEAFARLGHRFGSSVPELPLSLLRKIEAFADSFALSRWVRKLRPDVVHLHSTNPAALLYLRSIRRLRTPLVATAHVVTPHEPVRFQEPIYRRIHGLPDLIVAHSEFDRGRLRTEFGVEADRVTVIPHGEYGFFEDGDPVDKATARRSLGLEPGQEVALFFGYVREYKGLDLLLGAWPGVAEARPNAQLIVAGDTVRLGRDRRRELAEWANRLGVRHHFGYVPFSDVRRYFAAADVVVMPYRRISQSGVLYLALSLGVPVVATRVGALPEMLEDGDTALLVPPESPAELAGAIVRAFAQPELRERLRRGGLRLAAEHSWPSIAEQIEAAFTRIASPVRNARSG